MNTKVQKPEALLAQPLTLPNGSVIPNRLAKSAMSERLGTIDHKPTPEIIRLYERWAEGGIGLCITGNVMIDRRALGEPNNVVIEDERDLDALTAWARGGTRGGTQLWMQINHPGKQSPKGLNRENVSPSAIPFRADMQAMFATPRELRVDEIEDIIQRFARTAAIAKKAGFSGVQIHGAHGYLVSQFLSPHHNQRTDAWGGTPEKRRRFVLEVLKAMRAAVGPEFPIGIKLNSADFQRGGFTEEESLDTIRALGDAGIDLVEISGGTYEAPAMTGMRASTRAREAYFMEFAEKARAWPKRLRPAHSIWSASRARSQSSPICPHAYCLARNLATRSIRSKPASARSTRWASWKSPGTPNNCAASAAARTRFRMNLHWPCLPA